MSTGDERWTEVTPSPFPHEQEGLDQIRALLPDVQPFRAWSDVEFRDGQGKWHEVDLLVLGRRRLHLVELKYYAGTLRGDDLTWRREGKRPEDSPLKLARRKAQRLGQCDQPRGRVAGVGTEAHLRSTLVGVQFVRQCLGRERVDVHDHRMTGGDQSCIDSVRERDGVRLEDPRQQLGLVRKVGASQRHAVGRARVDRPHADREHLLPVVGEALGVDDQPGQGVDEPPRPDLRGVRDGRREPGRAGVGHPVQLEGERGVVEQQVLSHSRRDPHGGMRDVQQDRAFRCAVMQVPVGHGGPFIRSFRTTCCGRPVPRRAGTRRDRVAGQRLCCRSSPAGSVRAGSDDHEFRAATIDGRGLRPDGSTA